MNEIKLTEEENKEIDRILNLSPEEVKKGLNGLGITDEQIEKSIKNIKKLISDYLGEKNENT